MLLRLLHKSVKYLGIYSHSFFMLVKNGCMGWQMSVSCFDFHYKMNYAKSHKY